MNILMIGDIVGRPGRRTVKELLPDLVKELQIDLVIANGENAAGGNGITPALADELYTSGIDILTMGNHVWDKKEIIPYIEQDNRMVRPANYPPGTPGKGFVLFPVVPDLKIAVMNLSGRVFLSNLDCPFREADKLLEEIYPQTRLIILDFHAEATSEKQALGWYLDGRVTAVLGTHTHIQTADERLLMRGTAYITDVGMTGPRDSVLGVKRETVIKKFVSQLPVRFEPARGSTQLNAVLIQVDVTTGKAASIQRIQRFLI